MQFPVPLPCISSIPHHSGAGTLNLKQVAGQVATFRGGQNARASWELAISALPLAFLWVLMWLALDISYVLTLVLSLPAAGFLLRLFLIQHDCGHGSFFTSRRANNWIGRCIGVLTLTPYDYWRRTHAVHHAGTGNLERRGVGDVATLTVSEYGDLTRSRRLLYRLYRSSLVMFGIGPAFVFLLQHRLPIGMMRAGWQPWASTIGTTSAALIAWYSLSSLVGLGPFLLIHLPITLIAASTGVWLFYVQHQFEHAYWRNDDDWKFHEAAVYGSSNYILPPLLRWFTANIGLHHVHHLCSTVPFYRLRAAVDAVPELGAINQLTLRESLKLVPLALWDESAQRLVTFKSASAHSIDRN
jgi:acyl-lipid omega-6 desaturase (Delta-12 desaturase)